MTDEMPSRIGPGRLDKKRVLLVEDEYVVADDMARELAGFGLVVLGPLGSLGDAMRLVGSGEAIDGAVLDINLRGEMVFPLAEELRRRDVPFVFATGYERWSIPVSFQGVPLCEKPVEVAKVARSLFG
jgi:CheY-like chemotaxis protein